ncbi:MAG: chromosome segregation protein SMC [bacterium]
MYLKKVEIFGFKSFLKGLELELGPGIMAVVGPNGCGKSNISESIRWVLGEQNARLLRGETMEDVIFNGTRTRKPLGMAEVSLTIANDEGRLPIEFTEVKITRRVFRSGISEYYLNKTQVRLKDIRDLFADTGMGNFSYSLIERAMVDNLITDTSSNVRVLLEEAAGIVKYKNQERLALRKLEATEKDLLRIRDIVIEVEKRVRSLKRQESKARRFKGLTTRLRTLEVLIAKEDREALRNELASRGAASETASQELTRAGAELATLDAAYEEVRLRATQGEHALAAAQAEVEDVARRIASLLQERSLLDEREKNARERIRDAEEAVQDARARLAATIDERAAKEAELATIRSEADRTGLLSEERKRALAAIDNEVRALRAEVKSRKQMTLDIVRSGSERRGELGALEGRLAEMTGRLASVEAERARIAAECERLTVARADAISERDRVVAELARLDAERAEVARDIELRSAAHHDLVGAISLLSARGESIEGNLALLRDLERRYEGFRKGARTILLEAGEGRHRGVVGDLLRLRDEGLRSAISAALGGSIESFIVEGETNTTELLDFLRHEDRGRATFLLLQRFQAGGVVDSQHPVLGEAGVVGVARRAVESDPAFDAILDFLLGRVIVVDDLQTAFRLSSQDRYWDMRFVTRAGEVVHHPGFVTGGSESDGRHGFLERKGEIVEREREIERIAAELAAKTAERERVREELEAARARHVVLEAALRATRDRSEILVREAGSAAATVAALDARGGALRTEYAEIASTRETTEREIGSMRAEHVRAGEEEAAAGTTLGELEAKLHAFEMQRDEVARNASNAQVEFASLSARLESLKEEIARCSRLEGEFAERISAKSEEARQLADRVAEMVNARARIGEVEIRETREREGREERRDALMNANQEIYERTAEMERQIKIARKAKEEVVARAHALDVRIGEIQTRVEGVESRVREEFGNTLDELIAQLPEDAETAVQEPVGEATEGDEDTAPELDPVAAAAADEALAAKGKRGELAVVRKKIERIGPVNLVALEEFEVENERYTFLKTQEADLVAARDSLNETIRTVDTKARTLFVDTLDSVREHFKATFTTLFQGGEADIILEDPANPLESPIEIVARPGGKRLQRVALMSGGERALTAISILFAVYLHKPSPFCFLDEVDAPLDDANVGRFISLLETFSKRTQFIVITHNKRTTEAAHTLFGVTMEEPGVSKLVSVKLSELTTDGKPGRVAGAAQLAAAQAGVALGEGPVAVAVPVSPAAETPSVAVAAATDDASAVSSDAEASGTPRATAEE